MDTQLLGTGGTYYVMSQLALHELHASCTFGNAPYVDVLVSAPDGSRTVAIQVKTALWATRDRGRGSDRKPFELQWPLGHKAARLSNPWFFFALVDLRGLQPDTIPDVYVVPSPFVAAYCAPWIDDVKWARLHIGVEEMEPYKNRWELITEAIQSRVHVETGV